MSTPAPELLNEQTIDATGYDLLWRAQLAAELLACITGPVAQATGITHDHTAAVAEYISDGMREVLNRSTPIEDLI